MKYVWVFNGFESRYPSAVFSSEKMARNWIEKNAAIGTLTQFPLDISAYDFAQGNGYFSPTLPRHFEPTFISNFSNANNVHFHFNMDD